MNKRRWLLILWVCGMAALMTLPWSNFRTHAHWAKVQWIPFISGINVRDIVLNVLAFVPFGYLVAGERVGGRALTRIIHEELGFGVKNKRPRVVQRLC